MNLVGFRTLIVGLLMTIALPALTYLSGIDWTTLGVSPTVAFAISGVIMMAMRYISATPITMPNAVASVAALPDDVLRGAGVERVLTTPNAVGAALANLTPGNVVVQDKTGRHA